MPELYYNYALLCSGAACVVECVGSAYGASALRRGCGTGGNPLQPLWRREGYDEVFRLPPMAPEIGVDVECLIDMALMSTMQRNSASGAGFMCRRNRGGRQAQGFRVAGHRWTMALGRRRNRLSECRSFRVGGEGSEGRALRLPREPARQVQPLQPGGPPRLALQRQGRRQGGEALRPRRTRRRRRLTPQVWRSGAFCRQTAV